MNRYWRRENKLMCGICGFVSLSGERVQGLDIEAMTRTLKHRGPDDMGTFTENGVALGHTRLSVIDLTDSGHQPMISPSKDVVVVFNGEIYNFLVLRKRLEALQYRFQSSSDTEVILASYLKFGIVGLSDLSGMYAIAIYDRRQNAVHLVRDRFGIKPLYYAIWKGVFAFASEIKALQSLPISLNALSLDGLAQYMWFGHTTGETTCFQTVRRVPPGARLSVVGGQIEVDRSNVLAPSHNVAAVKDDPVGATRDILRNAVSRHLQADVPIGVFLSGGVDSSSIACIAAELHGKPVKTYSVGFDSSEGSNELAQSRELARYLATDHSEFVISGRDAADTIPHLIRAHDEPFADAANIPLFLLAKHVKPSVKVVLQGDGGDEVFGGYRRYQMLVHRELWCAALKLLREPLRVTLGYKAWYRVDRLYRALAEQSSGRRMALLLTVDGDARPPYMCLSRDFQSSLSRSDAFSDYETCASRFADCDDSQRMMWTDATILLPCAFLEKVDRATMAHGIEARVPFLDDELTSFVMNLPSSVRISPFRTKPLLRKAMARTVPSFVLKRRKTGFGVPYSHWLRTSLLTELKEAVSDPSVVRMGLFDQRRLQEAIQAHVEERQDNGFLLWKCMILAKWVNEYEITS